MTYSIVLPPTVTAKIRNQALYIAHDNPSAALEWYDSIYENINTLSEFPMRCPLAPENRTTLFEVRHLISGNYRTLFRIVENTVVVLDFKERRQDKPA